MDLNKTINDTMVKLDEERYVEQTIEKHMKKTIDDIIEDSLRSWSDFGKQLKAQIQEQLQFNLDKLDIPSYNHVIMNIIKGELERSVHEEGAKRIQEEIQDILGTAKEEYKLSELIKEMVEDDLELNELSYEEVSEITVIVEEKYGNIYIYLDPEEDVSMYQCRYMIVIEMDGTIWRAECKNKSFDNSVIMGGLYGVERTIFTMWTRKAKLIIDDYETSFGNPEYE